MRYAGGVSEGQHPGKILNKVNIYMNKEYKLVEAGNPDTFEMLVNERVNQGWTPYGDVSVQQVLNSVRYTQMMVREKRSFNEGNSDNGKQLLHG